MIDHCISTLIIFQKSFLLFLFIIMTIFLPFLIQYFSLIWTTLFLINIDYLVSSFNNFSIQALNSNITTTIEADTKTDTSKKPIPLTIDTSIKYTIKNDDALKMSPEEFKRDEPKPVVRKRHYSISSHYSEYTPQLSPTSSVSSFSSNWSMDSRRSHVEEMIHLFEMGEKQQHRRYSVDSHTYKKPLYIRERKFEYNPIALEWKKRAHTIQLSESKSTPTKRRMNPIPEKSQSTWA